MNILIVTSMYPVSKKQSRLDIPFVLHYFAKTWSKNNNVKVIVPTIILPKILKYIPKVNKQDKFIKNKDLQMDSVPIKRIGVKKYPKFKYSHRDIKKRNLDIIQYLEKEDFKPDIIICHVIESSIYFGTYLKKYFNCRLSMCYHNYDYIKSLNKSYILKDYIELSKYIDVNAFRSSKIYSMMSSRFNFLRSDNPIIVPSGIDAREIISENDFSRKANKKSLKIITVARLVKYKNINIIIEAVNQIKDSFDLELIVIGDGEDKESLMSLSKDIGSENVVKFKGALPREDVFKEMEDSDVFVLVSSPETFGMVYVEAMAKGCMVIGSSGEGIADIIEDGVNGFLCTPNNTEELKKKLVEIVSLSKDKKEEILKNSLDTVKNLTEDIVAEQYLLNVTKTNI